MIFGSYNPGWKCHDKLILNTTETLEYLNNINISTNHDVYGFIDNETSGSSCEAMQLCTNWTFNDEASTIVTEWGLVCSEYWVAPLIFSIQMIGVLMGTFCSGYVGDRFGRKYSVHGSAAILVVTNLIAIFLVSWKMYAVIRFFIGFGSGGILTSVAVYTFEFIPGWWRACVGTFPFWNLVTLTFGVCVVALKNWRHIHIATAIVSLMTFLPVIWLPESLRLLTVHGKLDQADTAVKKIARLNRRPVPDTNIIKMVAGAEKKNMHERSNYSYLDLFRKNVRKNILILGMTWFTLSFSNYMIGFGLQNLSGDFFLNFFLYIFLSLPMRLLVPIIITKMGRKYVCALFLFLSSLCSLTVAAVNLLASEEGKKIPSLVFSLEANMMSEAACGPTVVLSIERFPTGVRTMAYSYCNIMGRIASMIAPFMIPKEIMPIYGAFLILCGLQIINLVSILSIADSKGKPLADNMLMKQQQNKSIKVADVI